VAEHADVGSLQALEDLEAALGRFAARGMDSLGDAHAGICRKRELLNERYREQQCEVSRCIDDCSCADEDSSAYCQARLVEAESALANLAYWRQRVEDCHNEYTLHSHRFAGLTESLIPKARGWLKGKIEILRSYGALKLDVVGDSVESTDSERGTTASASSTAQGQSPKPLMEYPLPRGFQWVPLHEVDLRNDLGGIQSEADFRKATYSTILNGMAALRKEVLPRMAQDPRMFTSDSFAELDRQEGRSYQSGLQGIFDAFFGSMDYVYLERGKGESSFSVINGCHRIVVAQEMGWDAIPARVKDLNQV